MIPKQPKNRSNNQSWLSINTKVATGLQDKNPKSKAVHFIHYIQHKLAANGAGAQKFRWPSSSLLEQALVANKIGQICWEKVHVSKQDIELSQLLRG